MPAGPLGPPSFVHGTTILTSTGSRKIQDLAAGDLIETFDGGLRPISWIGRSETEGHGANAPVLFREGAIGNIHDLRVSPQHRVLINDWRAEAYFGKPEVLIPAIQLVDGTSILRENVDFVEYFHLSLDEHELIFSDGAITESYISNAQAISQGRHARAELIAAMPEMTNADVAVYPMSQFTHNSREAQALKVA